ncbi:hypothetical protein PJI17_18185 [Mycobacterium kansasii]
MIDRRGRAAPHEPRTFNGITITARDAAVRPSTSPSPMLVTSVLTSTIATGTGRRPACRAD